MEKISTLLAVCMSAVAMATPAAGAYRLLQTIPIPGDDGWDHPTVDSAGRRLYVTHGTHVVVIDVDLRKLIGKIDNTPGVHFTVIDPELDRGFISSGKVARLTIFNTKTLATIGEVKSTGENPGPTVFDPATKRVFAFNLNSHNATVVDSKDGKVVGAFDLGGKPELAGTDANGNVFVNLVQKNVVLQIDARKMAAGQTWPVAPCEGPRTMAVDQKNGRLFIGCSNAAWLFWIRAMGAWLARYRSGRARMIPPTIRKRASYIPPMATGPSPSFSRNLQTVIACSRR
jgi:hypothetical protein